MSYFGFNGTCLFWMFGVFVVIWRRILFNMKMQLCLHRLRPRPLWGASLQWYNIYFVGLAVLCVYSFIEFFVWIGTRQDIDSKLKKEVYDDQNETELAAYFNKRNYTFDGSNVSWEEFHQTFEVQPWLRNFNMVAVLTSPITLTLCVYQVYSFLVLPGHMDSLEREGRNAIPWMPFRRVRYLLLIFVLPTLYVASALRGNNRLWALLTGNVDVQIIEICKETICSWEHMTKVATETYKIEMEVANFFQYFAVWSFAELCGLFISEHFQSVDDDTNFGLSSTRVSSLREELQMVVQRPAFLGVWAFIAIGFVEAAASFLVSELIQHDKYRDKAIRAQDALESGLKPLLATFTILAVINMVMLSSVKIIKDKLGNANLKFNGTRLLILVGNIQESVIAMFTKGSRLYKAAHKNHDTLDNEVFSKLPFQFSITDFYFTPEKGYLLHVSLLLLECLLVVCLNILFWRDFDLHNVEGGEEELEKQMLDDDASSSVDSSCHIRAETKQLRLLQEEGGFCGFHFHGSRRGSCEDQAGEDQDGVEARSSAESRQLPLQRGEEQVAPKRRKPSAHNKFRFA